MGHIKYASDVGAPVQVAFAYTDNCVFVPDWMFGVAAFEPVGDADSGAGAVFSATIRLGIWHPSVVCEVTAYRRNAVIGYTLRRRRSGKAAPADSILGSLTLRFDPLGYGRSVLTSEVDYPAPQGFLGRIWAKPVDTGARLAVRRTLSQLRREIEEFHGTDLVGRIA